MLAPMPFRNMFYYCELKWASKFWWIPNQSFKLILLNINDLFLKVFHFLSICIFCLRINKASISILFWIYLIWKICFVYFLRYHERNRKKGPEGWNCNIKRENDASRANTVHLERWLCPQGKSPEICFSWSLTSSKLPLHTS